MRSSRTALPTLLAVLWAALGMLGGCAAYQPPRVGSCLDDSGCPDGSACVAGACEDGLRSCQVDAGCDVATGELCTDGLCAPAPTELPESCETTSQCPVDHLCNTATSACEPLRAGYCRVADQCTDATPLCTTDTAARPGRCVACIDNDDCGGGECLDDGTCALSAAPASCPDHASPAADGSTCVCDDGFVPDTATASCVAEEAPPEEAAPPPTECVPNASPVAGAPGQCQCNAGFVPNSDGSACVDPDAPPSTPPPSTPPSTPPPPQPQPNPSPPDDGCPENSSPDPSDDTLCICDAGFVANTARTACVEDMCETLGYYGDGEFCDDFCPFFDPDCA